MEDSLQFGLLLRNKRQELDWSQSELARYVGCAPITIRKFEKGERRPSRSVAERLAVVLRLQPEERDLFIAAARQRKKSDPLEHYDPANTWNNLPIVPPLFLGRETELTQLQEWIHTPHIRLMTLIGIGGVGKTRLALQAAGQELENFRDGICFVGITTSDTNLISTIADALQFVFFGDDSPIEQLKNYLREKRILFVIDSFEQVIKQTEDLVTLLRDSDHTKFIVTSREYLNTPDEWALEIQGLTYAPKHLWQSEPSLYSAPQFFLLRAKQMLPNFTLDPADWEAVHAICARLQGIPLAIELATSWIRILSIQEIANAIRTQLDILQTGSDTYPSRQRSLRAIFESTWIQLAPEMQTMLCQLSVFRSGFTAENAVAITQGNLYTLKRLRDHCLIHRNPEGWDDIHDLIRQFVEEKLAQNPEAMLDARNRHCHFYAALLRRLTQPTSKTDDSTLIQMMIYEWENFRVAWRWAIQQHDRESILGMLYGIYMFCDLRCRYQECREMLEAALDVFASEDTGWLDMQVCWMNTLWRLGELDQAQHLFEELLPRLNEPAFRLSRASAFLRSVGGVIYLTQDNFNRAEELFLEGWEIARKINDHAVLLIPSALHNLASLYQAINQPQKAHRHLEICVRYCQERQIKFGLAFALLSLGNMAISSGNGAKAIDYFEQSIAILEKTGMLWGLVLAHEGLAWAYQINEDEHKVCDHLLHALNYAQEIGALSLIMSILAKACLIGKNLIDDVIFGVMQYILVHPATWESTRLITQSYIETNFSISEPAAISYETPLNWLATHINTVRGYLTNRIGG
jgi:predicted ATPase/DNA-binding XRE family transcriptional regulator